MPDVAPAEPNERVLPGWPPLVFIGIAMGVAAVVEPTCLINALKRNTFPDMLTSNILERYLLSEHSPEVSLLFSVLGGLLMLMPFGRWTVFAAIQLAATVACMLITAHMRIIHNVPVGSKLWLLLMMIWLAGFTISRARPRRRGFCEICGYNLTGNVSGVCPECGTRIAPEEPSTHDL